MNEDQSARIPVPADGVYPEGFKFPPMGDMPSLDNVSELLLFYFRERLRDNLVAYADNKQWDDATKAVEHLRAVTKALNALGPCDCPNCTAERAVAKAAMH